MKIIKLTNNEYDLLITSIVCHKLELQDMKCHAANEKQKNFLMMCIDELELLHNKIIEQNN